MISGVKKQFFLRRGVYGGRVELEVVERVAVVVEVEVKIEDIVIGFEFEVEPGTVESLLFFWLPKTPPTTAPTTKSNKMIAPMSAHFILIPISDGSKKWRTPGHRWYRSRRQSDMPLCDTPG